MYPLGWGEGGGLSWGKAGICCSGYSSHSFFQMFAIVTEFGASLIYIWECYLWFKTYTLSAPGWSPLQVC